MSFNQNENKSKLNQLWNDLKLNLPQINFTDDNETITLSDDNISTIAIGSEQNLDLDSIELVEIKEDIKEKINNENTVDLVAPNSPIKWLECEKNFEKFLKKDADQEVELSDNTDDENDDLEEEKEQDETHQLEDKKQESLNSPRFNEKLNQNTNTLNQSKSNEQAVQITKHIFETTNSKLSMGIFDQINIDELLEKVDDSKYLNYTPNKLPSTSRLVNDENVLMKLAQLSHSISKDEDLNSLDLKTGALKPSTTKSCGTSTESTPLTTTSFNLIEKELNKNRLSLSEQLIKNDLNNFLKQHNIRDGNLVATRRIDLRPSQHINNNTISTSTNNKPQLTDRQKAADALMQKILNTKDDEKYFRNKSKGPLKFINDSDLSTSSSDSSDDTDNDADYDSKSLWIERYRRQKMNK